MMYRCDCSECEIGHEKYVTHRHTTGVRMIFVFDVIEMRAGPGRASKLKASMMEWPFNVSF